jgi:hypothetical protein
MRWLIEDIKADGRGASGEGRRGGAAKEGMIVKDEILPSAWSCPIAADVARGTSAAGAPDQRARRGCALIWRRPPMIRFCHPRRSALVSDQLEPGSVWAMYAKGAMRGTLTSALENR